MCKVHFQVDIFIKIVFMFAQEKTKEISQVPVSLMRRVFLKPCCG